jgi:hypothetical protein
MRHLGGKAAETSRKSCNEIINVADTHNDYIMQDPSRRLVSSLASMMESRAKNEESSISQGIFPDYFRHNEG